MAPSTGVEGCQCVNETASLASLKERSCKISTSNNGQEEDGVLLTTEGQCVPHSYGSSSCLRHDELHDPTCNRSSSNASTPDYCGRSWCYVDALKCRQSSSERVYRSGYFSREDEIDVFYSYSTCNSTENDWIEYQQANILGRVQVSAIFTGYSVPMMYKLDLNADTRGDEYYDSNVPYKGIFVDYWDELMNISKGDLIVNYTFASEANKNAHPESAYTAAMQDVADGLADMVVGQTWITEERLRITPFTLPLYYDKTVLVMPDPTGDTVYTQIFDPFHLEVWLVILLLIGTTALASVWFTWYGKRSLRQRKRPEQHKKAAYARLAVDEFLQKGTFFCSAGVEQDKGDTLPQKLLMFGFSFFILIVVSSYVANLAAFLTRPIEIVNIETVNEMGKRVCAHPALKSELKVAWPKVTFVFDRERDGEYSAMLKNYEKRKCDYLAVSELDLLSMSNVLNEYCNSGIFLTDSVVLEIPVAFAVRPELAAGVSHWMHVGRMNHSITLESVKRRNQHKHYPQEAICDHIKFDEEAHQESNDYAQIKLKNLAFPCFFYLGSLLLAIIVQLGISRHSQNRRESESRGTELFGRTSILARQYTMSRSARQRHARRFLRKDNDPKDEMPQSLPAESATNFVGGEDLALHGTIQHKNTNNSAQKQSKGSSSRVVFEDDNHLSDGSDEFHENINDSIRSSEGGAVSLGEQNDATSRLLHLIDSGALDDYLECVQDIRRQRES